MEEEGEPEAPAEAVYYLVYGMYADVESCEANQERQGERDKEPEGIPKSVNAFSDLTSVFLSVEYI